MQKHLLLLLGDLAFKSNVIKQMLQVPSAMLADL